MATGNSELAPDVEGDPDDDEANRQSRPVDATRNPSESVNISETAESTISEAPESLNLSVGGREAESADLAEETMTVQSISSHSDSSTSHPATPLSQMVDFFPEPATPPTTAGPLDLSSPYQSSSSEASISPPFLRPVPRGYWTTPEALGHSSAPRRLVVHSPCKDPRTPAGQVYGSPKSSASPTKARSSSNWFGSFDYRLYYERAKSCLTIDKQEVAEELKKESIDVITNHPSDPIYSKVRPYLTTFNIVIVKSKLYSTLS